MGRPQQKDRAAAMYEMYIAGHTAKAIGDAFGCTFQSVYRMFERHGLARKSAPLAPLPYVVFAGQKYTIKKSIGYFISTSDAHTLLHRDIWIAANGPIPAGMDVHHKDEDKGNNKLSNLELISKAAHASHHMTKRRAEGFIPASQWPVN